MSKGPLALAILPRGMDGLFMRPVEGIEPFYPVAAGSPEEDWARRVFDPERILPYRFHGPPVGAFPTTEEILRQSDLAQVLTRAGVASLLLTATYTPLMKAWADSHRIRMIAPAFALQRRLEDKLWFHRFMRRMGLPCPAGAAVPVQRLARVALDRPIVVQRAQSTGGEGTWFPDDAEGLARVAAKLDAGERVLVRERIAGRPYGIALFVAPDLLALSPLRLQCYLPAEGLQKVFAGIQWIPDGELPQALRSACNRTFRRLGAELRRRRFFGFANVDFMVDARGRIYLLECNPRMSAATAQLLGRPELLPGLDAWGRFLRGFLGRRPSPKRFRFHPMPPSAFAGSTLDVAFLPGKHAEAYAMPRTFPSGTYRFDRDRVHFERPDARAAGGPERMFVFAPVPSGRVLREETTLALILSNLRLYDADGALTAAGKRLLHHFGPRLTR